MRPLSKSPRGVVFHPPRTHEAGEATSTEDAPGTYSVTIVATDGAGNAATQVRSVHVQDTSPPVIEATPLILMEAAALTQPQLEQALLAGVTVSDNSSAVITPVVTNLSDIDPLAALAPIDVPSSLGVWGRGSLTTTPENGLTAPGTAAAVYEIEANASSYAAATWTSIEPSGDGQLLACSIASGSG